MKLKNKLELGSTLKVGAIPTASASNFSVLFENEGLVNKRIVGNIINSNVTDFIQGISVSFPSIFNYNTSITPSDANLVVSFKNQLAGTVFAAPTTLNGTPSFRKLVDSDLSETSIFSQLGNYVTLDTEQDITGKKTFSSLYHKIGTNPAYAEFDFESYPGEAAFRIFSNYGNQSTQMQYEAYPEGVGFMSFFRTNDNITVSPFTLYTKRVGLTQFTLRSGTNAEVFKISGDTTNTTNWFFQMPNANMKFALGYFTSNAAFNIEDVKAAFRGSIYSSSNVFANGFKKHDSSDNYVLLGGGGHKLISDFALASSLGDYLPLTGGTLSGDVAIVKNGQAGANTRFLTLRDTDYSTNQGRVDIAMLATNTNTGTNRGAVISMRRTNNVGALHFEVADNNLLSLIGHSQNVGVSVETPTEKLDVNGNIRVRALTSAGFVKTNANGVLSVDTNTYALASALSGYVPTSRTITAGNGLSGGGTLAANRTITLGTPSSIGLSTTNSVTSTSHTHALDAATTTAINNGQTAFSWGRGIRIDGNSEGVHNVITLDADLIKNSSIWASYGSANIPNYGPSKGAPIVNFTPYKSGSTEYGFSISARENRILFNTKEASVIGNWLELYHSGNFDPTNLVPYSGATSDLELGSKNLVLNGGSVYSSISTGGTGSRLFTNVFNTYMGTSAQTGILSLKFPMNTASATMFDVTIKLYGYQNRYVGEYRIAFYKYTSTTIHSSAGTRAYVIGSNLPTNTVRVGIEGSNICINLGDANTVWSSYLSLSVDRLESKFTGFAQDYSKGWSASCITDTSSYTSLVTIPTDVIANQDWVNQQIGSISIPTVNNGQLTLSTGTGLTGSATFTANQSGNSTFSVSVASTHKLPTTAEWNALSTQTLGNSTSNLIVSNTVQRAALTGDVTASQNSNVTTIANNAVTHAKYQNIPTQRILGRGAAGTGNVQELTIGANLTLSTAGVLSATNTDTVTRLRGTTSGTYTSGDLTLLAGANTTITQSGSNITIASTNTNTTYSAGTGLSLSGTTFGQTITTSGTGTYVQSITQTANGFQVNLGTPPNTNTTYSNMAIAELNTGTATTGRVISASVLNQWLNAKGFSTQTLTAGSNITISGNTISATNTTYSAGTLALLQAGTNTSNRVWSAKILADYVTSMIPTSILSYSSANGIIVTDWNSFALSEYAISLGYGSVTSGNYATSVGSLLSTTGFGSTNQGYSNSITKALGYSVGAYNSISATLAGAFGIGLINRNDGAFIVGRYNSLLPIEPYDTTSPHKQVVFAIGAGRDETDRFTALTVYGDGRADYAHGYDDSNWTDNTLVTKKWVQDNVGGSSSGGGGVAYRNVTSGTFNLSTEYDPSLAESVFNVRGGNPIVFIGGDAVFHDGYKVTIMTNDNRVNVSLDSSREVKFIDAEDFAVSYVEDYTSITFIYDKEYSSFRVYHKSFISLN